MRSSCKYNPHLSPVIRNQIQKKNNARSKKYQKDKRASGNNKPYVKNVLKFNNVSQKRDKYFGRIFFILHNTHPWYLEYNCKTPEEERSTRDSADEMVRKMLKEYSKSYIYILFNVLLTIVNEIDLKIFNIY